MGMKMSVFIPFRVSFHFVILLKLFSILLVYSVLSAFMSDLME